MLAGMVVLIIILIISKLKKYFVKYKIEIINTCNTYYKFYDELVK